MAELSDREQEILGNTPEEIEKTLEIRDEVLTDAKGPVGYAPPTLDGATLLFSKYGLQGTGVFRVYELMFAP